MLRDEEGAVLLLSERVGRPGLSLSKLISEGRDVCRFAFLLPSSFCVFYRDERFVDTTLLIVVLGRPARFPRSRAKRPEIAQGAVHLPRA